MHTFDSILNDLKALPIDTSGTLLVHSSMKAIGEVEGGADAVLDALSELMRGGLLVLPTHTWKDIGTGKGQHDLFDYRTEPVCIGLLPEMFRKREGVIRSAFFSGVRTPLSTKNCRPSSRRSLARFREASWVSNRVMLRTPWKSM